MEICHAFKKSNLHKFAVFIGFVDIGAPMKWPICVQQVTSRWNIQSQGLFCESSECLHSVFCCVPIGSKQPHCSPTLLTRFKLKTYCTVTRRMQLGLSHMSGQTTEGNKCFMGLACFAYVLKSRLQARSSWLFQLGYFHSGLCLWPKM